MSIRGDENAKTDKMPVHGYVVHDDTMHTGCCGVGAPHRHAVWDGFADFLLDPSIRAHRSKRGEPWPGHVAHALLTLRFGESEMQQLNKQQKRALRENAREKMRAEHVLRAMKTKNVASEIRDAFIKARFGGDFVTAKKARKGKLENDPHAANERSRMATYAPRSIADQALKEGNPFIRRTAKYRANCKHKWKKITSEWSQCKRCAWCKPRIPEDEMLRLPPILEGRELPPLSDDQQWINMRSVNTLAGVVLSKICRAKQVQYSFQHDPYILRYGIEVKFKNGWKAAGIFFETAWYRILPVLQANGDKPKRLWRAIQKELGLNWWSPWQVHPRLIPLGERMALYRCADCSFTRRPGWCSRHMSLNDRYKEEKSREEERNEASEKAKRKALRSQAKARAAREAEGKDRP